MKISKDDIITCESYKLLCDYVYEAEETDPPSGLVHVNMEEIPAFFSAIRGNGRKYVVVSSCSDFGLCYQSHHPVWMDARKWAMMQINEEMGYQTAVLAPRCDLDRCNIEDKYSVKCYSYTAYTFNEIPDNIAHWYMTNSGIVDDPRITVIPFGVAPNSTDVIHEVAEFTKDIPKEDKMYINWVNYTWDRYQIKEHYKKLMYPWVTIVDEAKPYKEYLLDLAKHRFILSPEGNGIDCYRNLEAIYMGSIPICEINSVSVSLSELMPMPLARTLMGVAHSDLLSIGKAIDDISVKDDGAYLSYWSGRFYDKLRDLGI